MLGVTLQSMDYRPIHRGVEYSSSPPTTETGNKLLQILPLSCLKEGHQELLKLSI